MIQRLSCYMHSNRQYFFCPLSDGQGVNCMLVDPSSLPLIKGNRPLNLEVRKKFKLDFLTS